MPQPKKSLPAPDPIDDMAAGQLVPGWNLQAQMNRRGLRFAASLHSELLKKGLTISASSVSRMVQHKPKHLDLDTLAALCDVLRCTPNDLLLIESRDKP